MNRRNNIIKEKMKRTLLFLCAFVPIIVPAEAVEYKVNLSTQNVGFWWYEKSAWAGGSSTDENWSYANADSMIEVKDQYMYYGGASRYWSRRDAYLQIDLSSFSGVSSADIQSATLNFYIATFQNATAAPAYLMHLDTQTTVPTGDAQQRLTGSTEVANSSTMALGWNSVDVTSFIMGDVDQNFEYSVFNFVRFAQEQDQNRLLSFYAPSADEVIDGISVVPYLLVTVPEPASYAAIFAGAAALALMWRRKN